MINNDRITEAYTRGVGLDEVYHDNTQILNDLGG